MVRRFNTAGPCRPEYHYMILPLRRLPEAPELVAESGYFVVQRPGRRVRRRRSGRSRRS